MTRKTNKTAPLLRLITGSDENTIENPIINEEFKEEVIHVRIMNKKSEKPHVDEPSVTNINKAEDKKVVGINVVSELVQEWLGETMKRFKICDCDICKAEMTVSALNKITPKYIYIDSKTDYNEVKRIKENYKNEVIKNLVNIAISRKNLPRHQ